MKIFAALVAVSVCVGSASAQEKVPCATCTPITIELTSADAMLDFLSWAQTALGERKKVIAHLMHNVVHAKNDELGVALVSRLHYGPSGNQKESISDLLGKENLLLLRNTLALSETPKVLVQVLRAFQNPIWGYPRGFVFQTDEGASICLRILKGSDMEALQGFEYGCRFGHYADTLRGRVLQSQDAKFLQHLEHSDFGKLFLTHDEHFRLRKQNR